MTTEAPIPFPKDADAIKPPARIPVMIATPKRSFAGPQDLPPAIGRALHELAIRGTPGWYENTGGIKWEPPPADRAFREQADKYTFEFVAAAGGMCRARNTCTAEFLTSAEFLLWLDDDLDKDQNRDGPGTLADMILRLLSHRQPAVGALYCTRKKRPQWACTFMPSALLSDDSQKDGLLQVAELAGGATLFHRKVFEELKRIFGDEPLAATPKQPSINYRDRDTGETVAGFYQNIVVDGDLLSEDYWMSYLCRCARIPLLVDTKIKLRHYEKDAKGKLISYPEGDWPPIPAEDAEAGA